MSLCCYSTLSAVTTFFTLYSLASLLEAASAGSGHCSIDYWPTMSFAEGSIFSTKLRTAGRIERSRIAAVCRGEAAIASDCVAR
jgi:hypothetical protein